MWMTLYAPRCARAYAALVLLTMLTACGQPPPPTPAPPLVRVAVTDLTAAWLAERLAAYAVIAPDVVIQTLRTAPARVSAEARAGQFDVALLATRPPDLFATPVGVITFTIIVHPDRSLNTLTLTQTQAIFSGGVTDWTQVGPGAGGAIQVVSGADESDAGPAFAAAALQGALPTRTALLAPTWAAMRALVSGDINAIGYLPAAELDTTVRPVAVGAELQTLIAAVSLSEPTGAARAFVAWLQSGAP